MLHAYPRVPRDLRDVGRLYTAEADGYEGTGITLHGLYERGVAQITDRREKMQADEIDEELQHMRAYGAADLPCRKEKGKSRGLPRPTADRKTKWLRSIPRRKKLPQRRLYLYNGTKKLTLQDVVLLGGGLKTKNDPEDCPNVAQVFSDAGDYADRLDAAIGTGLHVVDEHLRVRVAHHYTDPVHYDF